MSLASRIQQKLTSNRYELYFEEFDCKVFLSPLTVDQRGKLIKIKEEQKQQTFAFLHCAFDEEGNPAAESEKEVLALPDSIVGVCAALIMLMSQGASHNTLDKFVESYSKEMNPYADITPEEANPNV